MGSLKVISNEDNDFAPLPTFATIDSATSRAKLFHARERGKYRPASIPIPIVNIRQDTTLQFASSYWLDETDQTIFLAILALAAMDENNLLISDTHDVKGRELWLKQFPYSEYQPDSTIAFTTNCNEILRAARLSSNSRNYDMVTECLWHLSTVSCIYKDKNITCNYNLLSFIKDNKTTVFRIVLNANLASAIIDQKGFTRVSLVDRGKLITPASRLLYTYLVGVISPGNASFYTGLDKLALQVWGVECKNDSAKRQRRLKLEKALEEIKELGWEVTYVSRGRFKKVKVVRPQ